MSIPLGRYQFSSCIDYKSGYQSFYEIFKFHNMAIDVMLWLLSVPKYLVDWFVVYGFALPVVGCARGCFSKRQYLFVMGWWSSLTLLNGRFNMCYFWLTDNFSLSFRLCCHLIWRATGICSCFNLAMWKVGELFWLWPFWLTDYPLLSNMVLTISVCTSGAIF